MQDFGFLFQCAFQLVAPVGVCVKSLHSPCSFRWHIRADWLSFNSLSLNKFQLHTSPLFLAEKKQEEKNYQPVPHFIYYPPLWEQIERIRYI